MEEEEKQYDLENNPNEYDLDQQDHVVVDVKEEEEVETDIQNQPVEKEGQECLHVFLHHHCDQILLNPMKKA